MTIIAVNGSPRRSWNTATLLTEALEGAASQGADTELVHLYDLDFKGCRSCFACKIVGGPHNGRCAVKDALGPVLNRIEDEADALILGSPIYFGAVTGEMRSFMERLLFAPIVYSAPPRSAFPRKIRTGFVYTMNATEQASAERGYGAMFDSAEAYLRRVFGAAESVYCYDTCQFPDYSKVVMESMDPAAKATRRESVFPEDRRKALELGRRMAAEA